MPSGQGPGSGTPLLLGPQSVENCMCVLHNLSYRLDAEVPTRYRQLEYNARNAYTDKSSTGCFSNKSDKMMVSTDDGARACSPPGAPLGSAAWPTISSRAPKPETSPRGQADAKAWASGWCRTLGAEYRVFCLAFRGDPCS